MKKILFLLTLLCIEKALHAQYVYTIKADSVKITNTCDTAELIIENRTQYVAGFLFNKGRGRTEFRRGLLTLNDSLYLIGADTFDVNKIFGNRYFRQGGNSFGSMAVLGTKDNYPLAFIQKGIEKGRIDTGGNWLFNTTTNNGYPFQFKGNIWHSGVIYQDKKIRISPLGGSSADGDWNIDIGGANVVTGYAAIGLGTSVHVNALPGVPTLGIGISNRVTGGIGILGSTDRGIAIGDQSYAHVNAIAIGSHAKTTTVRQFVCGGPDKDSTGLVLAKQISDVYFGSGVFRNSSPGAGISYTINGSGAYGDNYTGGDITIAGGKGTGVGSPGSIIFSSAAITTSGNTLQSLSEKARIVGRSGNLLINTTTDAGYKLHVNGTTYITDTLTLPNIISKADPTSYKPMVVDASGNVFTMSAWPAPTRKSTTVTGASYTIPADIDVVFVNYAAGQPTITLPTGTPDREITIKNLSIANTVIISGLDTNESNSIAARGAITVKYTGSTWVGISKY